MDFAAGHCVPCEGGTPPMPRDDAENNIKEVPGWDLIDEGVLKIKREFKFPDFAKALSFVNKVGAIAEKEGHHPDICFTWGKVEITLFTHEVGGLTDNDFILAAKINGLGAD